MLGRGTRRGERHTDKSQFTVFDCFDGTLFAYFRQTSDETSDYPAPPTRTLAEIVEDVWQNRDREYNTRCLVKRLQRIDKQMSAEAREQFATFVPDGDLCRFASGLPASHARTSQAPCSDCVMQTSRTCSKRTRGPTGHS